MSLTVTFFRAVDCIFKVWFKMKHKVTKGLLVNLTHLSKAYTALFEELLFIHVASEYKGSAFSIVTACILNEKRQEEDW